MVNIEQQHRKRFVLVMLTWLESWHSRELNLLEFTFASTSCSRQSSGLTLNLVFKDTSKLGICMFGPIACMEGTKCMCSVKSEGLIPNWFLFGKQHVLPCKLD